MVSSCDTIRPWLPLAGEKWIESPSATTFNDSLHERFTMKLLLSLILAFGLIGCANTKNSELSKWSADTHEKAKSGEIKWSQYYIQLFENIEKADLGQSKGHALYVANNLITASQKYESGQISKEQFEGEQRSAKAYTANIEAQIQKEEEIRYSNGLDAMQNSFKQSQQYYQRQIDKQRTCTTYGNTTTCR
jgi:hypothetical protein